MFKKPAVNVPSLLRTAGGNQEFKMEAANASAYLNCSAANTPTSLDVKLQAKMPGTATWFDVTGGAFTQLTGTGSQRISLTAVWDLDLRWLWTMVGTSFTFSVATCPAEE